MDEPESGVLATELARWHDAATSALTRVELPRAIAFRRYHDPHVQVDESLLFGFFAAFFAATIELPLNADVLDAAASVPPPTLRALDAIHLASAVALGDDLAAVITYDTHAPRRSDRSSDHPPAVVGAVLPCVVPLLKEHAVTKGIYELEWPEERAERLGSWLRVLLEAGGRQRKALLAEFEEFHPRGGLARGIVPPLG